MQNVNFKAVFLGKGCRDDGGDRPWKHFRWSVEINGATFEYNTGEGHFTPYEKRDRQGFRIGRNVKPENGLANAELQGWLHAPTAIQVLECLVSDMDAGTESFNDFCANMGYSSDSLKALDTYRACMDIAPKLRKALGAELENVRKAIEERNS